MVPAGATPREAARRPGDVLGVGVRRRGWSHGRQAPPAPAESAGVGGGEQLPVQTRRVSDGLGIGN